MSHAIVVAQFRPSKSAYWLPHPARLAAVKIPTQPFWAIRFSFDDEVAPGLLCVISTDPPSLADSSFVLGPKFAIDSETFLTNVAPSEAQLTIQPPLDCLSEYLHQKVYLHTAPTLNVMGGHKPMDPEIIRHQLDTESFSRFKEAATANKARVYDAWLARVKEQLGKQLPHYTPSFDNDTSEEWSLFSACADPTYIFGRLHNPHAYTFEFVNECSIPFCNYAPSIYNEMFMFSQLCKDYRWEGVEGTIDWLEAIRAYWRDRPSKPIALPARHTKAEFPTYAPVSSLLEQNPGHRAQMAAVAHLVSLGTLRSDSEDESDSSSSLGDSQRSRSSTTSSDTSSGRWVWWLPFNNPTVARHFPRDREGTIFTALEPWLPFARRRPVDCTEAVKLYLELEALAAYDLRSSATSLPVLVHAALKTLAIKLDIPSVSRPVFFSNTLTSILRPQLYRDATKNIERLAQLGCAIVVLAPFSTSTAQAIRAALPPHLLRLVQFFPQAVPLHTPVPDTFFSKLRRWCARAVLPPSHRSCTPADILVASTGMGRVLGPAAADAHPTALVMQTGGLECAIEYIVGGGESSPRPSVFVDGGLEGLYSEIVKLASASS